MSNKNLNNTELNEEQLTTVSGGTGEDTAYAEVKCAITYLYLGTEATSTVTLQVEKKDNKLLASDITSAAQSWCTQHSYEYRMHVVLPDDGFFVVY